MEQVVGNTRIGVRQIQFDSRKVEIGDMFVAVRGSQVDGHQFIEKAIEKGAVAVVAEVLPKVMSKEVCFVQVKDSAEVLGQVAANYFDRPSEKLQLVGVTGTNGKTTTVTLLYELFMALGYKVGLISTIENKIAARVIPATHTTPDAVSLNQLIAQMVDEGCSYAFMEVSSHAIHQRRIAGVQYAGAVFTNITHDHLDYHQTFQAYIEAKKRLFDDLPKTSFALVNVDDKRGEIMLQNTKAKNYRYGIKKNGRFQSKNYRK